MKPFHQVACQTQNFKSHFVSNIIFILWEWWGDGIKGYGVKRGRLLTRWWGVSEDCYSKDKRSHQSKLKRALGLEWDSVLAGARMHACVQACIQVLMQRGPNSQGQSWVDGWGCVRGLDLNTGTKQNMWAQLNFSSTSALSQQHFHIFASITTHGIPPPQTHKMPVNVILFVSHHNK